MEREFPITRRGIYKKREFLKCSRQPVAEKSVRLDMSDVFVPIFLVCNGQTTIFGI